MEYFNIVSGSASIISLAIAIYQWLEKKAEIKKNKDLTIQLRDMTVKYQSAINGNSTFNSSGNQNCINQQANTISNS